MKSGPIFTVIGSSGFIGSNLCRFLRLRGHEVLDFSRESDLDSELFSVDRNWGHIFYCAGLTADFRQRPLDTLEAHVSLPTRLLRSTRFKSLLYLSSARVYANSSSTSETAALSVAPENGSDLYNLSKLAGEAVCLHSGQACKVVRLTNIYGVEEPSTNFLPSLLSEAAQSGKVEFLTTPESSKDFFSIEDAVQLLYQIALTGKERIYNVGRGKNVSNRELAQKLRQLGVASSFAPQAQHWQLPLIDTRRIDLEFPGTRRDLLEDLVQLLDHWSARRPVHGSP